MRSPRKEAAIPKGLELERMLSLKQACEVTGLSVQTWRRNYAHLIVRLSPRRHGVKLKDVLSITNKGAA